MQCVFKRTFKPDFENVVHRVLGVVQHYNAIDFATLFSVLLTAITIGTKERPHSGRSSTLHATLEGYQQTVKITMIL